MIKLISAHIRNFRQLRDVQLEFARNAESPLTVIRAENGTGKTTMLSALTFGLFGDAGLPSRRTAYRVHPLDWDVARDGTECKTEVMIRFATIDDETGSERSYDLIRTTTEQPHSNGEYNVVGTTLTVLERNDNGDTPVTNPTAFLSNRVLPANLKDVFFIDGDRALAFIEATDERSAKRDRVEQAVRQLLGLDILEEAERHVEVTRREAVAALKKAAVGTEIADYATREAELDIRLEKLIDRKREVDSDRQATDSRRRKADDALRAALAAGSGDRQMIEADLRKKDEALLAERNHHKTLIARQRAQLNSSDLLLDLAASKVELAAGVLEKLESEGVIPDTLPDVVRDRLNRGTCICGRDVTSGTDGHEALCELLEEVDQLESSQEILVHLSASARQRRFSASSQSDNGTGWAQLARDSFADVIKCEKTQTDLEKEVAELRAKISAIPERDISELEKMRSEEETGVKGLTHQAGRIEAEIQKTEEEIGRTRAERNAASKKVEKLNRLTAEETAAQDLLGVIRDTIKSLEGDTVDEVSRRMSEIFLQMIVADPNEGGIIRRAELTRDHDIRVHGAEGQRLDPDKDLSGAQRRALTLSFILALVQVSGVNAPNVIDTPLGMTSKLVRRSLLEYAAANSTQLVMFLTGSEAEGVEDILDRYTGMTYTLTFSDHYPRQLVNPPPTDRLETLVCDCDYYSHCKLCERVTGV